MKYVKTFESYNQKIIQEKTGYKKTFYQQDNIGTAKYTISYHDGVDTHKDGSPFFGIKTFSNKEKLESFIKELKKKGYTESLNPIKESKTESKGIKKIKDDFFNKLASDIDKKYFPDVKYYRDDKDDTAVHYAIELFNNGVSGYDTLINKLSKHCKDTKENIHKIVSKYIEDFGDYEYKIK
jgi:hypothetical protein